MFWIFFCVFCLLAAFVFVFREDATLRQFAVCEPFGFGICVKCNANGKDDPASFDNYHKMHPHMGQTNTKAWYLFCANVSSSIYLFLCVCMYVCNVRRTNNDIINRRKGKKRDFWIASHGHQMSIGVFSSISLDENALVFFFFISHPLLVPFAIENMRVCCVWLLLAAGVTHVCILLEDFFSIQTKQCNTFCCWAVFVAREPPLRMSFATMSDVHTLHAHTHDTPAVLRVHNWM